MDVLRDIILILSVLGVFAFGYFVMRKLDKFLEKNRKAIEKENEKKEPSCVMLTEEMSDEEITEEIRRFREKHESTRIVLYDSSDTAMQESMDSHTGQKQ